MFKKQDLYPIFFFPKAIIPSRMGLTGKKDAINCFDLYSFAGLATGAIPVLLNLYSLLTLGMPSVLYQEFSRKEIP